MKNWDEVLKYAEGIKTGEIIANLERQQMVERFFKDLKNNDYEISHKGPEFCIGIIENTLCHQQGESITGEPLRGTPFLLEAWEKFIIYNLLGFVLKGTEIVRFHEALIFIPRKNGKALSIDTDIPTPQGWKKMRDVKPGDYVFGPDGKPHKVTRESEIFNKPMFLVTFEDGEEIKASADHVWTVQTKDSRRTAKRETKRTPKKPHLRNTSGWYEITTAEMVKDFSHARADGKGTEYKYRVPMPAPVEYKEIDLPVSPYTFGVWLGDGHSKSACVTCSDTDRAEMMSLIENDGHKCAWRENKNRAGGITIDVSGRAQKNPFLDGLKAAGVYKNKHIPDIYLRASVSQRIALLQGLMDTDGTCTKAGQCAFTQKSKIITGGVSELLSSLGIKNTIREKRAKICGKDCGTVYEIQFWTDKTFPCFRLQRKRERLKEKLAPRMNSKSITNITPIPCEPSKCIAIDSPDHLYLAGKHYTATHNTGFAASLAWALSLWYRRSGSKCYITSAALLQSLEAFNFLTYNVDHMGERYIRGKKSGLVRIADNNNEHAMEANLPDGSFFIRALAANPDVQDSLNANICICDEIHAFKQPKQYNLFKECQKAYTNKLLIGISTAGDDAQGFLAQRLKYCRQILDGTISDEQYFVFICCANETNGEIDYTSPIVHEMANPNYGVSIRPADILNDSLQAQNDPQQRKDFFAKSLNVFTSAIKAWFDIEEFRISDNGYNWTLDELSKLPVEWYGGADLSRMYDLTAAALYGNFDGIDICITHAFFPITQAARKADEDNIPLFGWADDGLLTLCNSPTVNAADVVNWFKFMRDKGFKIKQVGHDRKFAGEEYFPLMKKAGFRIKDIPQYFYLKSQGFRHIEKAVKDGRFYYCHSQAYEYCVSNVSAVEKTDDAVQYEKIQPEHRIDLFDASVFAVICMIDAQDRSKKAGQWWGET